MEDLATPERAAPTRLTQDQAQELVLHTVATHAEALLRTAYRHSLCADDAHDAYQRGMEIFMRRARTLDPRTADRWLHVVVKREAMEVRRGRSQQVALEDVDYDRHEAPHVSSPEERVVNAERATRAAEALRRLKPHELRAMWLKALGHSYVDAAGNERRIGRPTAIRVDNRAPAAPVGLVSSAPQSATNAFSASWSLPADAGAPIVAARYQVCQGGRCGAVLTAASLTSIDGIALPEPGTGTLRLWLVDGLGHQSAAGAAELTLAYRPPPAAPPQSDPTTSADPAATPDPPPIGISPAQLPATPKKASAALKLSSTRRTGRRVTVSGRIAATATGRLAIRYRVRIAGHTRSMTVHATIRTGRFSRTFTLARTLARPSRATITVSYAGNAKTAPATKSATLTLRR